MALNNDLVFAVLYQLCNYIFILSMDDTNLVVVQPEQELPYP